MYLSPLQLLRNPHLPTTCPTTLPFRGELSLWHKIQGHGKGTSKVETRKSLEDWKYWQVNHFHECKKVFLPIFSFDHFTRRCNILAKQHRQPCRSSETLLLLWTSHGKLLTAAEPGFVAPRDSIFKLRDEQLLAYTRLCILSFPNDEMLTSGSLQRRPQSCSVSPS